MTYLSALPSHSVSRGNLEGRRGGRRSCSCLFAFHSHLRSLSSGLQPGAAAVGSSLPHPSRSRPDAGSAELIPLGSKSQEPGPLPASSSLLPLGHLTVPLLLFKYSVQPIPYIKLSLLKIVDLVSAFLTKS